MLVELIDKSNCDCRLWGLVTNLQHAPLITHPTRPGAVTSDVTAPGRRMSDEWSMLQVCYLPPSRGDSLELCMLLSKQPLRLPTSELYMCMSVRSQLPAKD
jgi:hypothetical protein